MCYLDTLAYYCSSSAKLTKPNYLKTVIMIQIAASCFFFLVCFISLFKNVLNHALLLALRCFSTVRHAVLIKASMHKSLDLRHEQDHDDDVSRCLARSWRSLGSTDLCSACDPSRGSVWLTSTADDLNHRVRLLHTFQRDRERHKQHAWHSDIGERETRERQRNREGQREGINKLTTDNHLLHVTILFAEETGTKRTIKNPLPHLPLNLPLLLFYLYK